MQELSCNNGCCLLSEAIEWYNITTVHLSYSTYDENAEPEMDT